ncbi:MAG TPA: TetR/AcrR family transcriptional regulator [Edaphobacter sp.]|jgi:AcrR family transcriptional regulator|nr:TetR/AcrR family transcriptional regulator [Edaphobacter sp.]
MKEAAKRAHEPWKAFQARQRNQDIKRDAVLQTAAHMFLEQGYRRTSMSDLAKRLQITKPALYYYFRNKEEILVECCRAGITLIETLLDKALVSRGTGLDKVKVYIEAYAKSVVLHDFGRCVSMLDENELSSDTRKQVRALKRRIDTSIRGYIEEGIADKSIAPCDPKLASFAMSGAINWIGTWYKPAGPLSGAEIASQFAYLLTDGLRTRKSRTSHRTADTAVPRIKTTQKPARTSR